MTLIIDGHQDIAYNALTFGRDVRRSALETRQREADTWIPTVTGETLLGWPEYQQAQVGLIFATIFLTPAPYKAGEWETQVYATPEEGYHLAQAQLAWYRQLFDHNPDFFRPVTTRRELEAVLTPWRQRPAAYPAITYPVGLMLTLEGIEWMTDPAQLADWYEAGVRLVGMVWAGDERCGGMYRRNGLSREGQRWLAALAEAGFILDITHMSEAAALAALEYYEGVVVASHSNVRALLPEDPLERHLSPLQIRSLIERDGLIGVLPFNRYLHPAWKNGDPRDQVRLDHLIAHIDTICQMAGNARHVALGTDFDGGFGYPAVPLEINTIADLPKLAEGLRQRGYTSTDIAAIFHTNWYRILEKVLPE
ncbi:membrane dipeptidase [uncultured Thermanaerothrix sp.]|uniref:dipeptidase n=1 Tax=uncultured Thermanaerothrix sp. TaxID=1195149 RepID=UPI0026295FFA|nr:membrane dipeptidase [uncultured Thermanaerothrix sp.]